MAERNLMKCWVCGKSVGHKHDPDDYFFWCNKDCFDLDPAFNGKEIEVESKSIVVKDSTLKKVVEAKPQKRKYERKKKEEVKLTQDDFPYLKDYSK